MRITAWLYCFFLMTGCQSTGGPEPGGQPSSTPAPVRPPFQRLADPSLSFEDWLAAFSTIAAAQGISPSTAQQAFAGVRLNRQVLELDSRQPEFTRPVWEYLASTVSTGRIVAGNQRLTRHHDLLQEVSRHYGVDPQYIVAIWGIETNFGQNFGGFSVIEVLATLGYQGRRQDFGREQLLAALRILDNGDITPARMKGSWAGAMGHTQFIPTTFLTYAVDFDGDGRRDLWESLPDVFASTANYLAKSGWRSGQPWGFEVELPPGFNWDLSDPDTRKPVADWAQLGVRQVNGGQLPATAGNGAIIAPAGYRGPTFLVFDNFFALQKYNNSVSYVLAVSQLADRMTGKPPIIARWPTDLAPLSRSENLELQRLLAQRGYNPGSVDGIVGPRTRTAVKAFQKKVNQPSDGFPTQDLLERLRQLSL